VFFVAKNDWRFGPAWKAIVALARLAGVTNTHPIMQNSKSFVEVHASRLHAGANNYVVLLGGFLAMGGLVFAVAVTGASKGVWVTLAVFFVGLIAVVYNCGKRIQEAEELAQWYEDRNKLVTGLDQIERHIHEIDGMSATDYMNHMSGNTTDALIESIAETIRVSFSETDAAFFSSKAGVTLTAVAPDHPLRGVETHRLNTLDYLRHHAASLKTIIAKLV
jgi:hypothetical protein